MPNGWGYNPIHGFDSGPPPPSMNPAQPGGRPQYITPNGWQQPQVQLPMIHSLISQQPAIQVPVQISVAPSAYVPSLMNYRNPILLTYPPQNTQSGFSISTRNHNQGANCPQGYHALPSPHCKIHVFKTATKPWQSTDPLNTGDPTTHSKLFVPCSVTIKQLMQNLGCTNDDAKKNVIYECVQKGNGRWTNGLKISGDDKDKVKLSIADMGWNEKRTGGPGEYPVVWLWVTKDGQ